MDKEEILKSIIKIDSDFVVSTSRLNRLKEYITELTGINFEFCDLMLTENGRQYVLKTSDDVLRASVKNDILNITSDNKNGEIIYTFKFQ
jgi:hypothetical protein